MTKKTNSSRPKIIDLTHTLSNFTPVHPFDEQPIIEQIRNISDDKYNDWKLSSGMHVGTHIDGPGHLTSSVTMISEIPIDRFIGKGYLIDARNKEINIDLLRDMPTEDNLIVVVFTGYDKKFGTDEYFNDYPVITVDVAQELVRRKVKMIGIDFFSPDHYPFATHKIFLDNNVYIIENLTHLEHLLNIKHFTIVALPLKIMADSSLARVIAIVDESQ